MHRDDIRRWVLDQRAAARREAQETARTGERPGDAIAAALALVALYGRLHGWPAAEDLVTTREDQEMWDRFARLRRTSAPQSRG